MNTHLKVNIIALDFSMFTRILYSWRIQYSDLSRIGALQVPLRGTIYSYPLQMEFVVNDRFAKRFLLQRVFKKKGGSEYGYRSTHS